MFYFGLTCCSSYSYGYIFKDGSFNAFILILRLRDLFIFFPHEAQFTVCLFFTHGYFKCGGVSKI